jgi:hypothetical protein
MARLKIDTRCVKYRTREFGDTFRSCNRRNHP